MPVLPKQDFLGLTDWDEPRLRRVLDLARRLKARHARGNDPRPFRGRHLVLVFQKPSLRTRTSFELGFRELGGDTLYLSPAEVGLGERESAADVARVLGRMADALVVRCFAHRLLEELARFSSVPVINALTDFNHPCQVFCDLLTIHEHRGEIDGVRLAWIGDGNNVAVSWIEAARRLPIRVTLACPPGYDPDEATLKAAEKEAPGRVRLVRDPREAVGDADFLYADTFCSMGQEAEQERRLRDFAGYRVDGALLAAAPAACRFLHCLPAHRGHEVTDEVMDGPRSLVFDQAANRLHGQKALLLSVLGAESAVP